MKARTLRNKGVQELVEETCGRIRAVFPEVQFHVYEGTDPPGIYIEAYTEAESIWEILDLVSLRLTEILEQEGIVIIVVPFTRGERPLAQTVTP